MVGVPKDLFVDAVKQTVAANKDFVPPQGKGSLYLRPLLFGSGPILGLGGWLSYSSWCMYQVVCWKSVQCLGVWQAFEDVCSV